MIDGGINCLVCARGIAAPARPYLIRSRPEDELFRGLSLWSCAACHSHFVPRTPSAAALGEYYTADYRLDGRNMADAARFPADHPWYLSRGLAVAQLLRTHLDVSAGQGPAKVVEIGAGYGHPLFALRRALGFALDVTAVEPDPTCHGTLATVADRIIAQYVSAPTAVSLPGGPFRVAIMLHVLEHLPDPSAYLMQLRECLEPGGLLALEVPNCTAARMSLYPHYVPHLYFFTQTGLGALLERCGFDVASIATYGPEYDERGASDTSFTRHPVEIDAFLARGALPPLPFPVFAESGPNRTFLRAIARVAAEGTRHRSVTTP